MNTPEIVGKTGDTERCVSGRVSELAPSDPDLLELVARWDSLSDDQRARILTVARDGVSEETADR